MLISSLRSAEAYNEKMTGSFLKSICGLAGGQTGAAVVMVAERAAEILLRGSADQAKAKEPELALA